MTNIEFRTEPTYYDSKPCDEDQLLLPIAVEPEREVHWIHGRREEKRRLLGKKTITKLGMEDKTYIDASQISQLQDPRLRYALRFANAANAVGFTNEGSERSSAHSVTIVATGEEANSQFMEASYSGTGEGHNDSFMQGLYRAAPTDFK